MPASPTRPARRAAWGLGGPGPWRGAAHRASATARGNHDTPRSSGLIPVPLHTSGCAGDRVGTLAVLAAPAQQSEEPVARGALRAVVSRGLLDTEGHSGIHMNDAGELAQPDVMLHRQRQLVDELTRAP